MSFHHSNTSYSSAFKDDATNSLDHLQFIAKLMEQSSQCLHIKEVCYENENFSIQLSFDHKAPAIQEDISLKPTPQKKTPVETVSVVPPETKIGTAITSPIVGIAYLAPSPEAEPFVKVGQEVKEGQVLLLVSAMKVMNPITSPFKGRISHIQVKDSAPVEYGEELLLIEPL